MGGTLSVNVVKPIDRPGGKVELKTSVGSILHDLCCMERPWGAFCHSSNYPIDATIDLLGNADNSCDCLLEWRKAAWNLLRGRYWSHEFEKAGQSQDISFDLTVQRMSWLPTGSGTNYVSYKSTWGITERQATSGLCAPEGTRLDCPSEDNNCKVPCWGFRLLLLRAIQRSILEFDGHSIWNMCWGTPLDWVVLCVSCFGCQQCLRDSDASSAFEITTHATKSQ